MSGKARQLPKVTVGESRNMSVDFFGFLDSGELLVGPPTVLEVDTSDLTIINTVVNTSEIEIGSRTVAIGEGVQFHLTGVVAGVKYEIEITVDTDSTPAQTLKGSVFIEGV